MYRERPKGFVSLQREIRHTPWIDQSNDIIKDNFYNWVDAQQSASRLNKTELMVSQSIFDVSTAKLQIRYHMQVLYTLPTILCT